MILNHKAAIEMMVADVQTLAFNRYTLLNLHGTRRRPPESCRAREALFDAPLKARPRGSPQKFTSTPAPYILGGMISA